MRWAAMTLTLVAVITSGMAATHAAVAQVVTTDLLAEAALGVRDVPGYQFESESTPDPGDNFQAIFLRTFVRDNNGRPSALIVGLLVPKDALSTAELSALLNSDMILRNLARTFGSGVSNFRLTGRLGVGDVDQSAVWQATETESGALIRLYADAFVQGRILGLVIYAAPNDSSDPGQLTIYAAAQADKILHSPLPAALTGALPGAPQSMDALTARTLW